MISDYPLLRKMRLYLADQERAFRAASLAESSRATTAELRALYTRHVDPPASQTPVRDADRDLSVSTAVRLPAS
jgi:hypothetical protein